MRDEIIGDRTDAQTQSTTYASYGFVSLGTGCVATYTQHPYPLLVDHENLYLSALNTTMGRVETFARRAAMPSAAAAAATIMISVATRAMDSPQTFDTVGT